MLPEVRALIERFRFKPLPVEGTLFASTYRSEKEFDGGSLLMVILFHAAFNFTTGCSACKTGSISAIISTLVMVWAVVVLFWFKAANLSRSPMQVI